jgi:FkbM family methyltransferase
MKDRPYTPPPDLLAPFRGHPLILVDVGARGGLQPRWNPIADHITWIGFEPDPRSAPGIAESALPARRLVLPVALSDAPGKVTFYRTRGEGDSSLLRPNAAFLRQFGQPERFDVIDAIELTADTLDAQLAANAIGAVDVLKLDTQGSELAILHGGEKTLASGVLAVDVEVEFSQLYEQQPLFGDVDAYLRRFDLQLFDVVSRRWPYAVGESLTMARGPAVWAETIYLRTAEALAGDVAGADPASGLARLAKACMVALLYGFPDFALALIAACEGAVAGDAAGRLRRAVETWDAEAEVPKASRTIELLPSEVRALQAIQRETGLKTTAQLRRAIRAWLQSHEKRAPSSVLHGGER